MTRPVKRYVEIGALLGVAALFSGFAVAQEVLGPLTFTSPQVAGGRANYASKCAKCHGSDLEGGAGPALTSGAMDGYFSGPVGNLADFLHASMPQDEPGTLTPEETATLIAFIASRNERAAGPVALPSDHAALSKMGFNQ